MMRRKPPEDLGECPMVRMDNEEALSIAIMKTCVGICIRVSV